MKEKYKYFIMVHGDTYAMRISIGMGMQHELYAGNLDSSMNKGK